MWRIRTSPEQRAEVIRLYTTGDGLTLREISTLVGVSESTIHYIAKKEGLPKRPYGGRVPAVTPAPSSANFEAKVERMQGQARALRDAGDDERAIELEATIEQHLWLQRTAAKYGLVPVPIVSSVHQQDTTEEK